VLYNQTFQMSGVAGIAVEPSGAIWPYRMVTSIFADLLSTYGDRFRIETETAALSITHRDEESSQEYPYAVHTPRGVIRAKHIVHCTNGYAGHLLPGLRGKIYPCKGHMSVQVPGKAFPRLGGSSRTTTGTESQSQSQNQKQNQSRSWSIVYPSGGLDYVTQNINTGELWYGGGLIRGEAGGRAAFGDADDTTMDAMTRCHLHGAPPVFYGLENWGDDDEEEGGGGTGTSTSNTSPRVKAEWSGIMGFTADALPLVGQLPLSATGRAGRGEWIAAGFNGYGMPNCWGSGRALAQQMMMMMMMMSASGKGEAGKEPLDESFPTSYLVTEERLRGMNGEEAVSAFFNA